MPKFEKGKARAKTAGRKKGTPNKLTKNIKENFEAVFEKLGGVKGFYDWAKKNAYTQAAFYQMYSKMLPTNVDTKHSGEMLVKLKFDFGENGENNK